jgi:hypothetical protein
MIYAYDLATITLDGKPFAQVTDMQMELDVAASEAELVYQPHNYSVEFTCTVSADFGEIARLFEVVRHPAMKPQGIATISFGILGTLQLPGTIEDGDVGANGVHLGLGTTVWDRTLALAVERAITHRPSRVAVVSRAILGENALLRSLGNVVLRKKGERKKRRAMRRLLRAAGITRRAA